MMMELVGKVGRRKIYYVQVRNNSQWKISLPKTDWLAFTIANEEDEELVASAVNVCINKNVSYTCSAGSLASRTEDYFDEEISWNATEYMIETKTDFNFEKSPITTAYSSIEEGLWFASVNAQRANFYIDKVVCLDFTKKKMKNEIIRLVEKINSGWLLSDNT